MLVTSKARPHLYNAHSARIGPQPAPLLTHLYSALIIFVWPYGQGRLRDGASYEFDVVILVRTQIRTTQS
jgi:hypothetical protein